MTLPARRWPSTEQRPDRGHIAKMRAKVWIRLGIAGISAFISIISIKTERFLGLIASRRRGNYGEFTSSACELQISASGGTSALLWGKQLQRIFCVVLISALSGAGAACTNNNLTALKNASQRSIGNRSTAGGSFDDSSNYLIYVARVLRTLTDTAGSFDLIGDGTGKIGQYCSATTGSVCSCRFQYVNASGVSEAPEVPISYKEQDLARCSSAILPTGITEVKISIHHISSDNYSNETIFRFNGPNMGFNPSDPDSYLGIKRFQCKEVLLVPYLFDGRMYDPFQSSDPELAYPLNYYTPNFGASLLSFVKNPINAPSGNGPGWKCPSRIDDPEFLPTQTVFSVEADSGGSKRIFPVQGSAFDRSTFHLARVPSGAFNVPVNAAMAPNTYTSLPATGTSATGPSSRFSQSPPPIGYGAAPVQDASGSESCPSTVPIPPGYQWVKVWQFRASLPMRYTRGSNATMQAGIIECNPGLYSGTQFPAVPDCGTSGQTANSSGSVIADRVMDNGGTGSCYRVQFNSAGSDIWGFRDAAHRQSACAGVPDPFGVCRSTFPTGDVPTDFAPVLSQKSMDNASREDYLFVVSPVALKSTDFRDSTHAAFPYTPYRFFAPHNCQSPDPDNPQQTGDCSSSKVIRYNFKAHDINVNADSGGGSSNRLPVFPICALQPIGGGN